MDIFLLSSLERVVIYSFWHFLLKLNFTKIVIVSFGQTFLGVFCLLSENTNIQRITYKGLSVRNEICIFTCAICIMK